MSSLRDPFKLSKRSYHLPYPSSSVRLTIFPMLPRLRVNITAHIYHYYHQWYIEDSELLLRYVWERALFHVEYDASVSWNERREVLHDCFHSRHFFFCFFLKIFIIIVIIGSRSRWATKTSSARQWRWPVFWQSVCNVSPQATYRGNVWKIQQLLFRFCRVNPEGN